MTIATAKYEIDIGSGNWLTVVEGVFRTWDGPRRVNGQPYEVRVLTEDEYEGAQAFRFARAARRPLRKTFNPATGRLEYEQFTPEETPPLVEQEGKQCRS